MKILLHIERVLAEVQISLLHIHKRMQILLKNYYL